MRANLLWTGTAVLIGFLGAPAEGWQAELRATGSSYVRSLAVDSADNVLAAGSDDHRGAFLLVKFSSASGRPLWRFRASGAASAIGQDAAGDVSAAGYDSQLEFLVVKVRGSNGTLLWRRQLGSGVARALAVDASGDVIVGGLALENGSSTVTVMKLSGTTGAQLWRRDIDGTAAGNYVEVSALVVDAVGDVIAVGSISNAGTGRDFLVAKLAGATGSELWRREVNGTASTVDAGTSVTVDAAGDVVAVGVINHTLTNLDWLVMKLSGASGAELWSQQVNGGANGNDAADRVQLDANGDAAVIGRVADLGGEVVSAIKFSGSSGAPLWRQDIGASEVSNAAVSLTFDAAGDLVVVAPVATTDTETDARVAKLSGASGAVIWQQDFNGRLADEAYEDAGVIAVDGHGNAVAGASINNLIGTYNFTVLKLAGGNGADVLGGTRLKITDVAGVPAKRSIRLQARHGVGISPGSAADPTSAGAFLEIRNPMTGEVDAYPLPASNWHALTHDARGPFELTLPATTGFKYVDARLSSGPCKHVVLGTKRGLQAICRGKQIAFSLNEAAQGALAVRLVTGSGPAARQYCMVFGGTIVRDASTATGRGVFDARDAPAPVTCP